VTWVYLDTLVRWVYLAWMEDLDLLETLEYLERIVSIVQGVIRN
jgi:hypothetical protein